MESYEYKDQSGVITNEISILFFSSNLYKLRLHLSHCYIYTNIVKHYILHSSMMVKYTIVWLDALASDPESSFGKKLEGNVQIFINSQDCINYIQTHSDELIYFIVSGSLAQEVVPAVFDLDNLIKIFLYCGSVLKYAEWGIDYIDKMLMFDHGDDLLERLWSEIESHLRVKGGEYIQLADEYKKRALKYKQPACG